MAVADDLATTVLVPEVGTGVDPGGDFGLDGIGQETPGPVPEDVSQDILSLGQGDDADVGGRLSSSKLKNSEF